MEGVGVVCHLCLLLHCSDGKPGFSQEQKKWLRAGIWQLSDTCLLVVGGDTASGTLLALTHLLSFLFTGTVLFPPLLA